MEIAYKYSAILKNHFNNMPYPLVIAYRSRIYQNEFEMTGGEIKRIKIIPGPGFPLHPDTLYHWDGNSLFSDFETTNNGNSDLDAAIRSVLLVILPKIKEFEDR